VPILTENVQTLTLTTPETDRQRYGNDNGEVPLVSNGRVRTNAREIEARQSKVESLQEKIEDADVLTKRERLKSWRNRLEEVRTSLVVSVPEDVSGVGKREIVQNITEADVSAVDKRLLTSVLVAEASSNVETVETGSQVIRIWMRDEFLSDDYQNYIEVTVPGDEIAMQLRCMVDDSMSRQRGFAEAALQEADVLKYIEKSISAKGWGWVPELD
jgi:hypothetical protein